MQVRWVGCEIPLRTGPRSPRECLRSLFDTRAPKAWARRAQLPLPVVYEGVRVELGYRIDLLVEETVVVELKTVAKVLPIHEAQLLSYLKLSECPVGLLINFPVLHLKDGIKRMVNNL